jgi:hypothetical protein
MRIGLAFVALIVFVSSQTAQPPESLSDCRALRIMKRLARIDAYMPAAFLEMIQKQEQATCAAQTTAPTTLWNVKPSDGTWVFPNGETAISRSGWFFYTRGTRAKLVDKGGDIDWRYPDGVMAKATDGTWRLPNGSYGAQIPNLVAWACSKVSAEVCQERKADIDTVQGDEKTLAVIELAVLAGGRR